LIITILGVFLELGPLDLLPRSIDHYAEFPYYVISDIFFTNPPEMFLAGIGLLLLIGIPVIMLIYGGIKLIFNIKGKFRYVTIPALILWIAGIIITGFVAWHLARDFNYKITTTEQETMFLTNGGTIYLEMTDNEDEMDLIYENDYLINDWDHLIITRNNEVLIAEPKLRIRKSDDLDIHIITESTARGRTRSQARDRAENTDYDYYIQDSTISFDQWFRLPEREKWRNQEIFLTLEIPEGKKIRCDRNLYDIIDHQDWKTPHNLAGRTWVMTAGGLEIYD